MGYMYCTYIACTQPRRQVPGSLQALYVVAVTVLFPGSILALAAGAVFGLVLGSLLVWIGTVLGQTLAFVIGR